MSPGLPMGDVPSNNPLFSLDLEFFLSALSFISGQYAGTLDLMGKQFIRFQNNAEIHIAINKAFTVFENWPNNFHTFLNWRKGQENKFVMHTGLYKDFGTFYVGLFQYLPSLQFNFLRNAFQDYLTTRWDGGYAAVIKRKEGVNLGDLTYLTKTKARKILKTDDAGIDQLIESGELKAKVLKRRTNRMFLIESASIEKLKVKFEQLISRERVAKLLGLSLKSVRDLILYEYLKPLRGPTIDGYPVWKFNRGAVLDLYQRIRNMIPKALNAKPHNTIDFRNARERLSHLDYTTGRFVQAILDGKITLRGENGKTGFSGLLFDKEEISRFIRHQPRTRRAGRLSITESAEVIGCSEATVYFLAHKKILLCRRVWEHRGFGAFIITPEAIQGFNSAYVVLNKAASNLGTSVVCLSTVLKNNGILPISGPSIDGNPQYMYRKSELESTNLSSMLNTARSRYNPKNRMAKYNLDQIATILGISKENIRQSVNNGLLKPCKVTRTHEGCHVEYLFTSQVIENYKKLGPGYHDLISTRVAATLFHMPLNVFRRKYVETKLLIPFGPGTPHLHKYFPREDILRLLNQHRKL
jgi:hypothetical protein